ncbi:MAG: hypothetical protein OEZ06_06410 [Myxococcales bacterium]|nr:hypothetical protein [Myxococcales bacterium]
MRAVLAAALLACVGCDDPTLPKFARPPQDAGADAGGADAGDAAADANAAAP